MIEGGEVKVEIKWLDGIRIIELEAEENINSGGVIEAVGARGRLEEGEDSSFSVPLEETRAAQMGSGQVSCSQEGEQVSGCPNGFGLSSGLDFSKIIEFKPDLKPKNNFQAQLK